MHGLADMPVASANGDVGGQISAGILADDGHPAGIGGEIACLGKCPGPCRPGIFMGCWKAVLGREAIADGNHDGAGAPRDGPGRSVMAVEIAGNETAAVEIKDQGIEAAQQAKRAIDARGQRLGLAIGDFDVLGLDAIFARSASL